MESWRTVWRDGLAPQLSTAGLEKLLEALHCDDERLLQGATTSPPPLPCVKDWAVEGACLIGYCGWQGDGLGTVAEVAEAFGQICFEVDKSLGEPAGCRWLLSWFDETPREEVRLALIPEVSRELARRRAEETDVDNAARLVAG